MLQGYVTRERERSLAVVCCIYMDPKEMCKTQEEEENSGVAVKENRCSSQKSMGNIDLHVQGLRIYYKIS